MLVDDLVEDFNNTFRSNCLETVGKLRDDGEKANSMFILKIKMSRERERVCVSTVVYLHF